MRPHRRLIVEHQAHKLAEGQRHLAAQQRLALAPGLEVRESLVRMPSLPGIKLRPALPMARFAGVFFPMSCITAGGGTMPTAASAALPGW